MPYIAVLRASHALPRVSHGLLRALDALLRASDALLRALDGLARVLYNRCPPTALSCPSEVLACPSKCLTGPSTCLPKSLHAVLGLSGRTWPKCIQKKAAHKLAAPAESLVVAALPSAVHLTPSRVQKQARHGASPQLALQTRGPPASGQPREGRPPRGQVG